MTKNVVQCGTAFGPSEYGQIIWDFQTGPYCFIDFLVKKKTAVPLNPEYKHDIIVDKASGLRVPCRVYCSG